MRGLEPGNEAQQSSLKGDEAGVCVAARKERNKFQRLVSFNFLSTEAEGLSDN